MADEIKITRTLATGIEYVDPTSENKKMIYIKIPNPKSSLTEQTIRETTARLLKNGANTEGIFNINSAIQRQYQYY